MISTEDGVLLCCGVPVFWTDCDRHEPESEGCYMAVCEECDLIDRDCEEGLSDASNL